MNDPFLMKIEEYLDGTLPEDQAAEFESHLEGCDECRAEIDSSRRIRRLAQTAAPVQIPEDLGAAIRRRLARAAPRRPRGRVLALRWVAAAAAAAILLLVVFPSFQKEEEYIPLPPAAPVIADRISESDTSLEDWFDQASNSGPGDFAFLVQEAQSADLLAKVRDELSMTRGAARNRLLAMEDLLIQLENDPAPEYLADEARLVAKAGR